MSGATGTLVSGIIWLTAGFTALYGSQNTALLLFLVGGMLIFPISVVLDKLFGRSGKHNPQNPLGQLAMESTVMMLMGIAVALAVYTLQPLWFFPCMLMVIAGRYLTFATLYGTKFYWALGASLAAAAYLIYAKALPFHIGALTGGVIEIIFAGLLVVNNKQAE